MMCASSVPYQAISHTRRVQTDEFSVLPRIASTRASDLIREVDNN